MHAFSYLTGCSSFTINYALVVHMRLCRSLLFRMIDICLCMFAVCPAGHWGFSQNRDNTKKR